MAPTVRFKARGQVIQDVAPLLPAGRDDGQHALHEPNRLPSTLSVPPLIRRQITA